MRIAIDLRPLMSGKITGVEVYIESMLKALFESDSSHEYVVWYNAFKDVDISRWPVDFPHVRVRRTRIPNKLLNLCLSFLRWPKIDRLIGGRVDVLWVPDPRPAPVSSRCRKVVTFHDLSFEDFKYSFNFKTRLWHRLLRPRTEAREAAHLIAVSQFTKGQLVDTYGIPHDKITVVYEAAAPHLKPLLMPKAFQIIQRKYALPDRYFLCLSTLEPRKNIQGIVRAYLAWKNEVRSDVRLVIAGKRFPEIFSRLPIFGHPGIVMPGFIDEDDKAILYSHALAFLYPSFYEGFGLPILEAMACGAPVVTSDATATAEVAGDAAFLVNPNHAGELKEAMHKLYRDSFYREQLIEKGFKRAGEFSWKKAAKLFLEIVGQLKVT